jgi:hypothetical protein
MLALLLALQGDLSSTTQEFTLKFEIRDLIPVEPVELWVTTDGGQTWKKASEAGVGVEWLSVDGQKQRVRVKVPTDGTYGFYPQLKDAVSWTMEAPKAGQAPTVRVKVGAATTTPINGPVILQPRKDDEVPADTVIVIRWAADGYEAVTLSVVVGGKESEIAKDLPARGSVEWRTPPGDGDRITIRLMAKPKTGSPKGFELKDLLLRKSPEPVLRWLKPDQAVTWNGGQTVQLQWTSLRGEAKPGSAALHYSIDDGDWIIITKGLEPAGFYLWTVPWQATENLKLRVTAVTKGGSAVEGITPFAITVKAGARPDIGHARRHADKARVLAGQMRTVEAIEEYEKALGVWPEYPEALHDLGTVYAKESQYAKALEYFLRSRKASPSRPLPYVTAAGAEIKLGLFDDAMADLRDAVELGADSDERAAVRGAELLWQLVVAYAKMDEWAKADEAAKLLLQIRRAPRELRAKAQEHLDHSKKP